MTESTEQPWVVTMRRKLRERGYVEDEIKAQVGRMTNRFPFLRGEVVVRSKSAAMHRAILQAIETTTEIGRLIQSS